MKNISTTLMVALVLVLFVVTIGQQTIILTQARSVNLILTQAQTIQNDCQLALAKAAEVHSLNKELDDKIQVLTKSNQQLQDYIIKLRMRLFGSNNKAC
jgi:Tfp pilus assembly protein PilO